MPKISRKRGIEAVQVMMCSATLVPRIRDLVLRFAPNHIVIDLNKAMEAASDVKQFFYSVGSARKKALLEYLLRRRSALKVRRVPSPPMLLDATVRAHLFLLWDIIYFRVHKYLCFVERNSALSDSSRV
jgi:superfamily II DNA/RNA helicase